MKLSIIIPVYNVEKYIKKCIESVLHNDMVVCDYEIIVVDDESPDNSIEIVKEISLHNENIRIISQKNKGLGGARNTGILAAIGKYVLFLDSDDWYLPNVLRKCIEISEKNNLDILEFGAVGIDEKGKEVYKILQSSDNKIMNGIEYSKVHHYMDSACNKLYNRNFLIYNNFFFLERIYIEDYEFNTRVFFKANRVMAIDSIIACFLQTPNSITRNESEAKKQKMQDDIIQVIKIINKLRIENNEHVFFEQKLGFLVATLFYHLVKNRARYNKFLALKSLLEKENCNFVDYPILDKKKNFFRVLFLKNFFLFRLISK